MTKETIDRELRPEDLRFTPPRLPRAFVENAVSEHFGLTGRWHELTGERDQNFRLDTLEGRKYVVKVSSSHEDPASVDFQVKAMLHIERADAGIPVPRIVRSNEGSGFVVVTATHGHRHCLRVLTYLDGAPFPTNGTASPTALHNIGRLQGRLCRALSGYRHPASGHFMAWDIGNGLIFNPTLLKDASPDVAQVITEDLVSDLQRHVSPELRSLRRQVIYNDFHAGNLIMAREDADTPSGVIDFGDMVEGPVAQEVSVALEGFLVHSQDVVRDAAALVGGFHAVYPLEPEEVDLQYDLILMRSALAVLLFDFHVRHGLDYRAAEIRDRVRALSRYSAVGRGDFTKALHTACGHQRRHE